jgi:hypothetical protein
MLAGAVIYQVPISMIFLSKYTARKINRWMNVGAAALSAATILGAGSLEPHYLFAATVEILTLSYITWTALTWPESAPVTESAHGFGVHLGRGVQSVSYSYRF